MGQKDKSKNTRGSNSSGLIGELEGPRVDDRRMFEPLDEVVSSPFADINGSSDPSCKELQGTKKREPQPIRQDLTVLCCCKCAFIRQRLSSKDVRHLLTRRGEVPQDNDELVVIDFSPDLQGPIKGGDFVGPPNQDVYSHIQT